MVRFGPLLAATIWCVGATSVPAGQPGEEEALPVRQFIMDCVKASRAKTMMADPSGRTYAVQLAGADSDGVSILRDDAKMLLTWKQLKPHLLVARLAMKVGFGAEMVKPLRQLLGDAPKDLDKIRPLLEEIEGQIAADMGKNITSGQDAGAVARGNQPGAGAVKTGAAEGVA